MVMKHEVNREITCINSVCGINNTLFINISAKGHKKYDLGP